MDRKTSWLPTASLLEAVPPHRYPLIMRRILLSLLALALPLAVGGAGQPVPQRKIEFTAEQQANLAKVSSYLNSIHTLKSNFAQLGPQGQIDQGTLYIEKPGRMRFEFQPPSSLLIVSTGGKVYVKNGRLNAVSRYDLSDTPLGILLNDDVNLLRNPAILDVEEQSGALLVRARTSTNRNQSNILLVFAYPQIELRQWVVRDNQGGSTTVALSGTQSGVTLDDELFAVPVKTPAATKPGG